MQLRQRVALILAAIIKLRYSAVAKTFRYDEKVSPTCIIIFAVIRVSRSSNVDAFCDI